MSNLIRKILQERVTNISAKYLVETALRQGARGILNDPSSEHHNKRGVVVSRVSWSGGTGASGNKKYGEPSQIFRLDGDTRKDISVHPNKLLRESSSTTSIDEAYKDQIYNKAKAHADEQSNAADESCKYSDHHYAAESHVKAAKHATNEFAKMQHINKALYHFEAGEHC